MTPFSGAAVLQPPFFIFSHLTASIRQVGLHFATVRRIRRLALLLKMAVKERPSREPGARMTTLLLSKTPDLPKDPEIFYHFCLKKLSIVIRRSLRL
jgi:hypothetical protein